MIRVWQKMCLSFILMVAMFVATGNGYAGDQEDQVAVGIVSAMQLTLKLTDVQAKQVMSVVKDFTQQARSLKADGLAEEVQQSKLKSLRDDMDEKLANYLTAEQMTMWKNQKELFKASNKKAAPGSATVGDGIHPSVAELHPQNDNGVLVSESPDKIKSSGVW